MTDNSSIAKKDRRAYHNILIASLGIIPAAALVLASLYNQAYISPNLLLFLVFVFPVSVLCGFVSGLLSPKKAIVWAPLWACIAAPLLMANLSGAIHDASIIHSSWHSAWVMGGIIVAGLSALAMEYAVQLGYTSRMLGVFILVCLVFGTAEYTMIGQAKQNFEREIVPQIVSQLNTNYICVPIRNEWRCNRKPTLDSYELQGVFNGEKLSVIINATDHLISGISYHHRGTGALIRNDDSARQYLKKFGFRNELLNSLSRQHTQSDSWTASLEKIKLTLSSSGDIRINTLLPHSEESPSRTQE